MHIEIHPNVEGIAAERLLDFAAALAVEGNGDPARLPALVEQEAAWARRTPHLNGQTKAYEACMRLLADLRALKWRVRADTFGIELVSPRRSHSAGNAPDSLAASKARLRQELRPVLASQFAARHVRAFIAECENPAPGKKRRSICALISDGADLAARIERAAANREAADPLADAIDPYLQLVPGEGETEIRDEFTGLRLGAIWRYFRYTWAIPQTAIPGRQLFYLIRDRAHPCHAIIGIAALGNSPLIATNRDRAIGWTTEEFSKRLLQAAAAKDTEFLTWGHCYLLELLEKAFAEVDPTGLVDPAFFADPPKAVIDRLQRRASEFASERKQALKESAEADRAGAPLVLQETEAVYDFGDDSSAEEPPVSLEVLNLEGKTAREGTGETKARRLLVAKKRAFELARLLKAKTALRDARAALTDPATLPAALLREEIRGAISTALLCAKSDRVGTNMLEITTCGAIAPYNHLLGGKLVALLLLSPEVADDYRRRYGERPSIISSQLKNAARTKDCTLAWLNTTSLYAHGSSQYERLRLPAGIIAPDQPEIRYRRIGDTVGYGTVQFSDATVRAIEAAWEEAHQYSDINSIFGEGFSPKFRKIRDGMNLLGFNPTVLMRHDQLRRVYAVPLWESADRFLRGESCKMPGFIRKPDQYRDATARIATFWRTRWLASRLHHAPALEALRSTPPRLVGDIANELAPEPASLESAVPDNGNEAGTTTVREGDTQPPQENAATVSTSADLNFWRDIARAGPETCADELSDEALARLHVPQPLDDFLLDKVRQGCSLVLTGNAGDGKTHLLRRLEPELSRIGAVVERDATAAMRPDDIGPVLEAWKQAHAGGKPYCVAANEYPFHLLCRAGRDFPPVAEAARQAAHRLVYGDAESPPASAGLKVLVVDLSLRNPLHPDFSLALLRRMLDQPAVRAAVESRQDPLLTWNHRQLSEPRVQERLASLLTRCSAAGQRAPVRELLIWFARLLFGDARDEVRPANSPGRWYASRLFDQDERFTLSGILRTWADPAAFSHPRWDWLLERGALTDGWTADGPPRGLMGINEENFRALKRRFYFEHDNGAECFELDPAPGADLLRVLTAPTEPDDAFKRSLIESINRAYCADPFPEMTTRLFLWIGHRFHEQPSRAHIANQSIPETDFALRLPRLPVILRGALPYQPDHLLLVCQAGPDQRAVLRVDNPLRSALAKLEAGLPRQLLPDRELFRLERFIEGLRTIGLDGTSEFMVHHHELRSTLAICISEDKRSFTTVRQPQIA